MRGTRVLATVVLAANASCAACGGGAPATRAPARPDLAARYPLAALDDRALCDRLLARTAGEHAIVVDPEPALRRKVIVSDLHLGPGDGDPRFAGIEDFYAGAEWAAFLADHAARGPTDVVIAGDFIEFWQIATARGDLPDKDAAVQPGGAPVLAADQEASLAQLAPVLRAHADVFRELGAFLARGDHRVVILAGNHDADLQWPRVQLAIARAIDPVDPARLVFVDGGAYEHGGVHLAHGHDYDAANMFATRHAPFGRDRDGRCRLQSSWGEVFVDRFYTETERQLPFIDNLYPVSAGVLWGMKDEPEPARDLGAVLRFVELVRTHEPSAFNKDALGAVLQEVLGTPGKKRGPASFDEVLDHVADRMVDGDTGIEPIADALLRLRYDPELAGMWSAFARAGAALPDVRAAFAALRTIDPDALLHLREQLFGAPMDTAAKQIMTTRPGVDVVVFGHTHEVGGSRTPIDLGGRTGYYANTGSWLSVASVADLRARGLAFADLSLADRAMFPTKMTAVIVEYADGRPAPPVVVNAK
jgi:UDP-2,3-diacylglucosamine pyrophosphatase LpxH